MTENQEEKLNAVHDAVLRMEGRFDVMDERIEGNREAILSQERARLIQASEIETLKQNKAFVLGAAWVIASSAFLSLVGFIISLFIK